MSRTIIDYCSFSGCPTLLTRCKEMAKQRFQLGRSPYQFESQHPLAIKEREQQKISHFAESLAVTLGCHERDNYANKDLYFEALNDELAKADIHIDESKSFNDCYNELIYNIGIDMLDVLCHGEIESFLELLNTEITFEGNVWTLEKRGGFSGYRYSANLLVNGTQAGKVAWGAKNFGYMVSFSGKGCEAVDFKVLHKCLNQMPGAKLTRVDLALDDLEGSVSIDHIKELYQDGLFHMRGKMPVWGEFLGGSGTATDHRKCGLKPDRGRTFYVGDRSNGKVFRAYHKGAQMKCEEYPEWNRFEVQIGNRDRVIPLDILIDPDPYFSGSYPALSTLIKDVLPIRISTSKVVFNTNLENMVKHAKVQYGKLINVLAHLYESPDEVIKKLTQGFDIQSDIPDRLNLPVGQLTTLQKSGDLDYG
ncbi:replication initiation factor domain-containing protein [Vibrio nigripulchritudo]|uniref:replication initiation factor domain-containing protein n=1 Tax=Vibrio nigripulchritudo TaxID=28173 RepID=UPI00249282D5|nr:replication initiation factor domain-containing protein [Vibrio nigripulchritudo]BDU37172.1 hypothetical protein TUMSATVNIG2_16410 [Vibrio nigripulchritudo]BDU45850.1 hypothetical protein TUMSATVNIG3_46480 [Vibrio nigripulchritudo]